ncbi:amidohydrolase family protein [Amycolatopsis sp. GM8]|uniref:amidohydrolase family protein n=1 Tax=Amycolatopsis sp. GM8 TaxID=2896530 RepID=UPI001F255564|nr:amidohydrolase family protein [Amycolatopsis sp. GM8]
MTPPRKARPALREMAALRGERYLIVSSDSHAGPPPEKYLRPYCPEKYVRDFDEYCAQARVHAEKMRELVDAGRARNKPGATLRELGLEGTAECVECAGHWDPHVRLAHMDSSGVAAEVVFAGGQNFEELPFLGKGWNAGLAGVSTELRSAAQVIWNRWLADHISVNPDRLVGVLQNPVWDVDLAIKETEWGASRGLRVLNLPAPRHDLTPYTDHVYDRLWAVCEETGTVLVTHSGGGEEPIGAAARRGRFLHIAENHWLGNRALAQLIFGGVFHRHPALTYVLTEQRTEFAPDLVTHLDTVYDAGTRAERQGPGVYPAAPFLYSGSDIDEDPRSPEALPEKPSFYWRQNCVLSGSFLAPYEVAYRHEVGLNQLLWGTDYPHLEGTWPHTPESIRHTFHDVPEDETRLILGETACVVYGLDRDRLWPVARQIGPTPQEVATPLTEAEIPRGRNGAFRETGTFA